MRNEMMALVGGCVVEGEDILVPDYLKDEFKKIITTKFNINPSKDKYDLIIEDKPSDILNIYNRLNDKGIYITVPSSLEDKELFKELSKLFWIVMPYYYLDNLVAKPLVFASKKLHPTADIIRHRSDFVEGSIYYTTDVHLASFVLPKYIFENIKDVIRL